MKYSFILSAIISSFLLLTEAQAYVTPSLETNIPKNFGQCLKQGGSKAVCDALFDGLKECERDHSEDEESWKECIVKVEREYNKSFAKGVPVEEEQGLDETPSVETRAVNADYNKKTPKHKGFMNAEQ